MGETPSRHTETPPLAEIGPGSLLWEYAGDLRTLCTVPSAEFLQMMHPAIAQGVQDHSRFMDTPLNRVRRVVRSASGVLGAIYNVTPEETGTFIRKQHPEINGIYINAQGQEVKYQALNPDVFWWAHATFQEIMVGGVIERFRKGGGITDEEREQLVREGAEWYRRYGVSMKDVPLTYVDFQKRWQRIAEGLEMTPYARQMMAAINRFPTARVLTVGGIPADIRQRFPHELHWTDGDQRRLTGIENTIQRFWPRGGLYVPVAKHGRERLQRSIY